MAENCGKVRCQVNLILPRAVSLWSWLPSLQARFCVMKGSSTLSSHDTWAASRFHLAFARSHTLKIQNVDQAADHPVTIKILAKAKPSKHTSSSTLFVAKTMLSDGYLELIMVLLLRTEPLQPY